MTRGRGLAAIIAGVAAFLLIGRGAALLFVDHAWYASLHADAVWWAGLRDRVTLYGGGLFVGAVFAFANLYGVRRSVVALIVPKRIGNVEFGEEVAASRLIIVTAGMSVIAAIASLAALPPWTTLALWRSNVHFGDADPYFHLDLGHYVATLPLEAGLYEWVSVLLMIVVLLVVVLYALTPSLRWGRSGLHITTHARRHLAILAMFVILLVAWGFRLDAFDTLVTGSGANGAFTRLDYQWVVPTSLALTIVTIGAAVVMFATGWMGQTAAAFVTVTLVIVCAFGAKIVLPWIARASAENLANAEREAPYVATRKAVTARAFPIDSVPLSTRVAVDSAFLAAAPSLRRLGGPPDVVYPGAAGFITERDPERNIPAPRVGNVASRLLLAWAEQTTAFFRDDVSDSDAVVRVRDARERVRAIAPIFAQSRAIGAQPAADGVTWIIDLYAVSDHYPLSASQKIGSEIISYRRHAATAYIDGATGAATLVRDTAGGPIANAWFDAHPGRYLAPRPPAIGTFGPRRAKAQLPAASQFPDSLLRIQVLGIYLRMRAALDSGNFHAFGDAFDSLGAAVGVHKK